MKKLLWLLALSLITAVCAIGFTACDDNGGNSGNTPDTPTHVHAFVDFTVDPTCTTGGYTLHKCSCGEEYKDTYTDALGHNYVDGKCTVCKTADPNYGEPTDPEHTHNFIPTVVPPTCTTGGYTLRVCSCGEEKRDTETQPLGHNYEWTTTQNATCEEKGIKSARCSRCGATIVEEISATGHNYEWTTTKEPTENADGEQRGTCKNCGAVITKIIPSLTHEHAYSEEIVSPTCTEQGYTLHQCRCGDEYYTDETQPLGHNYEWTVTKTATCTAKGERKATCSRCPATMSEEIEMTEHNGEWVINQEPTCIAMGTKWLVCSVCGEKLREAIVEKVPHEYSDTVTPPTCTAQGYTTHKCVNCDNEYKDSYTVALGHNYGVFTVTKEPTCTEKGEQKATCSRCGAITTEEISATGHSYKTEYTFTDVYHWQETTCGHTDAIIKTEHTLNDKGICTVCGYDSNATLALEYVAINNGAEYAVDDITDEEVKTVYIPDTYNGKPVTKINEMVFYGNTTVEKIVMGDNITDMGASAFYNCSNLRVIKLSSKLSEIKEKAFYQCRLQEITIPDSVTSIGNQAFAYCYSLTSIVIPDSVTSIGYGAFSWCESLTSITIGGSVTSIGNYAFDWCESLTSITFDGTIQEWNSISKGSDWKVSVPATKVHCTDGNVNI